MYDPTDCKGTKTETRLFTTSLNELAEMVGGGFRGIVVLILGNILIIVLEGLIDFIQCLRLQFYELFSKYYTGDGEEFVPLNTEIQNETI